MTKPAYGITWNFKVGSLLFVINVVLSMMYWAGMLREIMHGQPNYSLVLVVCTLIGCLSGLFYGLKENWILAFITGGISGAGSFVVFDWYTRIFHKTSVFHYEGVLICAAGAVPGLILFIILYKIFDKKKAE